MVPSNLGDANAGVFWNFSFGSWEWRVPIWPEKAENRKKMKWERDFFEFVRINLRQSIMQTKKEWTSVLDKVEWSIQSPESAQQPFKTFSREKRKSSLWKLFQSKFIQRTLRIWRWNHSNRPSRFSSGFIPRIWLEIPENVLELCTQQAKMGNSMAFGWALGSRRIGKAKWSDIQPSKKRASMWKSQNGWIRPKPGHYPRESYWIQLFDVSHWNMHQVQPNAWLKSFTTVLCMSRTRMRFNRHNLRHRSLSRPTANIRHSPLFLYFLWNRASDWHDSFSGEILVDILYWIRCQISARKQISLTSLFRPNPGSIPASRGPRYNVRKPIIALDSRAKTTKTPLLLGGEQRSSSARGVPANPAAKCRTVS